MSDKARTISLLIIFLVVIIFSSVMYAVLKSNTQNQQASDTSGVEKQAMINRIQRAQEKDVNTKEQTQMQATISTSTGKDNSSEKDAMIKGIRSY